MYFIAGYAKKTDGLSFAPGRGLMVAMTGQLVYCAETLIAWELSGR